MKLLALLLAAVRCASAGVVTADAPDGAPVSARFSVSVAADGEEQAVGVFESAQSGRAGDTCVTAPYTTGRTAAWAAFSFADAPVTVTVASRYSLEGVVLRPLSYGLTAKQVNGSAVSFVLQPSTRGYKVSVEGRSQVSDGVVLHSLMVFADPPEDPAAVPDPSSPTVLFYPPGLHNVGGQLPVPPNVTDIYVAAGAWVDGGFVATGSGRLRVSGCGVVSGRLAEFLPGPQGQHCAYNGSFCWALINLDRSSRVSISGVTLVDPPKYYLRTQAAAEFRGVKLVAAWPCNTDGFVSGPGGVVSDCFARANDDNVKLYETGMQVRDTVLWQMQNGASFQLGWWTRHDQRDILVDGVDVIHFEPRRWPEKNHGVVSMVVPTAGSNYSVANITWRNVRVEETPRNAQFLRLDMTKAAGYAYGWNFVNVSVSGGAEGVVECDHGQVKHFVFEKYSVNGSCVRSMNESGIRVASDSPYDYDFEFSCG
eukprot:TRINITY_DN16046_c0_g1_i1.p1 TRINITY_DN16046_c0_g1~~TRINITY_DN16046_c0_g1_i1.p1  ORF type:complete len:481 (+),score=135.47 TRINITY_DN16046_c0_g1_i1:53-1495(+)